jgi:hypothetical protein
MPMPMPTLILLAAFVVLAVIVSLTGRDGYLSGACGLCRRPAQLNPVTFRYNIGMLVARRHATLKGAICKSCIHKTFWKYAAINVSVGWLGYVSLFVAPSFLLINGYHYLRSTGLKAPDAQPAMDTGFGSAPPPIG